MSVIVLLDTGVLGMVTNPRGTSKNRDCRDWLDLLVLRGHEVLVPEIADYELRRELIRSKKARGLVRLDRLGETSGYLALSTDMMRLAAALWAESRNLGQPTAGSLSLDADVILAAQARIIAQLSGESVVVATNNIRHLSRYVDARVWQDIAP